jgi:serine/threonine-protein kinase
VTAFKSTKLWRSDGFAGGLVVLALLTIHFSTQVFSVLERGVYNVVSTSTQRQPSSQIAVIAIDDQSIAQFGSLPWSRDVDARLINALAEAKAKTIVHTGLFFEPQRDRGSAYIQQMKEVLLAADGTDVGAARQEALLGLITQAEVDLNTDGQLALSFKNAGNVIISSLYSPSAQTSRQPIGILGQVAAGIGHLNPILDSDGVLRQEALWLTHAGQSVPSLALLTAVHSMNIAPSDAQLRHGDTLQLGSVQLRTDAQSRMLPQFYPARHGKPAFPVDSAADVLSGKVHVANYANKIVLIGVTATGVAASLQVPGHQTLTSVELLAHVTSSILKGHFYVQPAWSSGLSLLLLVLVAAMLLFGLPRLTTAKAALVTGLLLLVLMGAEVGLLAGAALWLPLVFPSLLLFTGFLAMSAKRLLLVTTEAATSGVASGDAVRMMGLALQGQGQFDMAFEHFKRVPMSDALMDNLYRLALDFEGKHHSTKAQAVFAYMGAFDPKYKDLKVKPENTTSDASMLGRYQVDKELGKGAMGLVYLGKDPQIGRLLALKTMALAQEFDGEELVSARERFFREAKAAGRLQHPDIVTIFDAGEAQGLAYIAMEYVTGHDLQYYCKPDRLLPLPRTLNIVARVAQALSYAHSQQVIHRDIKPANVMFDMALDIVKVTDFGIARITDASKTKTGLVMGTPSFMSPEQIAGKPLDGRSDLYSLGVMLYQMLSGYLPFRGGTMAELMYKIANEPPDDIAQRCQDLPPELTRLLAKLLSKPPQNRYQDGAMLATDLMLIGKNLAVPGLVHDSAQLNAQRIPSGNAVDLEF